MDVVTDLIVDDVNDDVIGDVIDDVVDAAARPSSDSSHLSIIHLALYITTTV